MPVSLRAAVLRTALERALDAHVHLLELPGYIRIHAPAPPGEDRNRWEAILAAMQGADRWGSTDATGTPEIWAEIDEDTQ